MPASACPTTSGSRYGSVCATATLPDCARSPRRTVPLGRPMTSWAGDSLLLHDIGTDAIAELSERTGVPRPAPRTLQELAWPELWPTPLQPHAKPRRHGNSPRQVPSLSDRGPTRFAATPPVALHHFYRTDSNRLARRDYARAGPLSNRGGRTTTPLSALPISAHSDVCLTLKRLPSPRPTLPCSRR